MLTATTVPPVSGTLKTWMNYFLELDNGGTDVMTPGTAGTWLRKHNVQEVQVRDIREAPGKLNLDNAGFQLVTSAPVVDAERVKLQGYERAVEIIKGATGATRVIPFNHLVRRDTYKAIMDESRTLSPDAKTKTFGPSMYCHVGE